MIKMQHPFSYFQTVKMTMCTPNTGKCSYNDIMPDFKCTKGPIVTLHLRLERHS